MSSHFWDIPIDWLIDPKLRSHQMTFPSILNLIVVSGEQYASGAGCEQEKAVWLVGGGDRGREEVHGQDLGGEGGEDLGGEDVGGERGEEGKRRGGKSDSLGKMNEEKDGKKTSMELIKQHKCDGII